MGVPVMNLKKNDGTSADRSRFRLGMALWDASFVLAEFMSNHRDLAQLREVQELMGESGKTWNSWNGKCGVELGAGLGLPSIVGSKLGAKMIATDGDDKVLDLLGMNVKRNAPSCQVEKLLWGRTEPLAILGLKEPDFVLAADVVYGSDPEVWDVLLETIKVLSGSSTLV